MADWPFDPTVGSGAEAPLEYARPKQSAWKQPELPFEIPEDEYDEPDESFSPIAIVPEPDDFLDEPQIVDLFVPPEPGPSAAEQLALRALHASAQTHILTAWTAAHLGAIPLEDALAVQASYMDLYGGSE